MQLRGDIKQPDFMKVLTELTKVEHVRSGRLSSKHVDKQVLHDCSHYLDKVTGTRKQFLSSTFTTIRELFRAAMKEAKIVIESDGHLFNLIGRFCQAMKKVLTVQQDEAFQRLKRFVTALALRANISPRSKGFSVAVYKPVAYGGRLFCSIPFPCYHLVNMAEQDDLKDRDHKKLGKELDLFTFSNDVGKGLPLWTPKGSIIRRELERFIVDEEIKRGYLHVYTPDIAKLDLYKKSGHYPHYKDSMYAPIDIDGEEFMLRPMTCPHHFELYLSRPHSYRELPIRYAELAKLYRYEQSGELMGLQRVRTFELSDAHIICASEEQAAEEVSKALDLIEYCAGVFGLKLGKDFHFRLSLGDANNKEKYYQNDAAWKKGEELLREVLQKRGEKFVEAKDEAAFYGPKIDVQMKNVNGKEDTAFTVQYDFCMPDRFDLTYVAEDGTKKRAFVVHRSSIGAIERLVAFLIEFYAGAFPLWLAPVQVAVLPVSEKHEAYAQSVLDELKTAGIRAELSADDSLGKRIRTAKLGKVPYFIVVGDQEAEDKTITAENNRNGDKQTFPIAQFIPMLLEKIKERSAV